MKQFLESQVQPMIATKFHTVKEWRDIGDPSLWNADPMDSTKSVAEVIENTLGTVYEAGEMGWDNRREALTNLFTRNLGGQPGFLVSSDDDIMIEALGGGWHYHKNAAGQILTDKPVKDQHSHPGDALSHGITAILNPSGKSPNRPVKCESDFNIFDDSNRRVSNIYTPNDYLTTPDWSPFNF
jgi:hypothetical protein